MNENSSRFAKYLDVSFSKMGKVTGARVSVFLLEHTRLMLAESEVNKNFHIFSLMYSGLKNQGKLSDFGLERHTKFEVYSKEEAEKQEKCFTKLVSALKLIGFRDNEMETIYRILSAILNLTLIEFKHILTDNNTDGSVVVSEENEDSPVLVRHLL